MAAVGVVAAIDATRSEKSAGVGDPRRVDRERLARELRRLGAKGTLVYTDRGCEVRARRLPELASAPSPSGSDTAGCELSLSPDGRVVAGPDSRWSPDGRYRAFPGAGVVHVDDSEGRLDQSWDGSAPAWRRDGVLTVATEDGIVEVRPGCAGPRPCIRRLVPGEELRAAASRHAHARGRPIASLEVLDAAWLAPAEVVVTLLQIEYAHAEPRRRQLVAVFRRGRLEAWQSIFEAALARLVPSPDGYYVAAEPNALFRWLGGVVSLPPPLLSARALAFSPDGRLLAAAARGSIYVVPIRNLEQYTSTGALSGVRLLRLPIAARDIAWASRRWCGPCDASLPGSR